VEGGTGQEHLFWGQVGGGEGAEERLRKGVESESQRSHKLTEDDEGEVGAGEWHARSWEYGLV
jgi:hypothetical protein